ncbi:MAG: TonB-dependent receptor [Candidatus Sedimenticola sp. (ex Thyasira tokunagai)]
MRITKQYPFALTALSLFIPPAQAADELQTVNVTAERIVKTADETLASVSVLTRSDIEKSQSKSIDELLNGLPGITIDVNGGYGKNTSVNIRGTNNKHVLVLIDGIRIGSATLGSVAWQHLPVSQIERIEVVRGPRSHLYGSEPIGGVVQIFTRKGKAGTTVISAEAGTGSNGTHQLQGGVSGGDQNTHYSLHLSHFTSEGIDATVGNNPDRDGYTNTSVSGTLSHQFAGGAEIKLNLLRAQGENEIDRVASNLYDTESLQQSLGAELSFMPLDWWDLSLSIGRSWDKYTEYLNGAKGDAFNTTNSQLNWQNDLMVSDSQVVSLGMDLFRDEVSGTQSYTVTSRDNSAIFAQYQQELDDAGITAGLRHDDNETFGGHTTGSLGFRYNMSSSMALTASYGSAFKAPTFNDLYWPIYGNANLKPEESKSYEIGLSGNNSGITWSANLYRTRITNLIDWACVVNCSDADWANDLWQPSNINSAKIKGLELSAATEIASWRVNGNLSLLDPRDGVTDNQLRNRSKKSFRLDADRSFGRNDIGVTWRLQGESYNDAANTTRLPGFGLTDLRLAHKLDKTWQIKGQVKNLFDHQYQTNSGYNQPGRELFVSIAYQHE